jgi:short-subunit dehydrogenase
VDVTNAKAVPIAAARVLSELGGIDVLLGYPPTTATPGLDRENETKPAESWAIEGKSKVYTAEQVARSLLRGTARGKFEVVTGAGSWFIWISMRLMPWLGHYIMDRELEKFRRKNQPKPNSG